MQTHLPSVLRGPVTPSRAWWPRAKPPRRKARSPAIRSELVQRIRNEIAAGTYEDPAKWEAALDRLLQDLDRE